MTTSAVITRTAQYPPNHGDSHPACGRATVPSVGDTARRRRMHIRAAMHRTAMHRKETLVRLDLGVQMLFAVIMTDIVSFFGSMCTGFFVREGIAFAFGWLALAVVGVMRGLLQPRPRIGTGEARETANFSLQLAGLLFLLTAAVWAIQLGLKYGEGPSL